MKTHLLIDGDIIAFIAASACQNTVEDGFGFVYPFANKTQGQVLVDNLLFSLEQGLQADSKTIVLSDPKDNWRHLIDENYKGNRDPAMKPLLLGFLKDYLREKYGAVHEPSLEADDLLGILATLPQPDPDVRQIVVGRDKDFRGIPGLHHQWKDIDKSTGKLRVREYSKWEAARFHLIQTLAGDAVDGYPGCPGLGMERATRIIDDPVLLVPQEGVKTRGVHKGEAVTRWFSEPTGDLWACVVSHYRKAGQGEEEALRTARLANLLLADQYDFEKKAITLWTPDRLRSI